MDTLPSELVSIIFKLTDISQLTSLCQTNKRIAKIC